MVRALARQDVVESIVVLADRVREARDERNGKIAVQRCWRCGSPLAVTQVLGGIRRAAPDLVWFDIHFVSFGLGKVASFLGNLGPALAHSVLRAPVVVTLHDFLECVDVERMGLRCDAATRLGARLATKALLRAHRVVVLLPSYRTLIASKYHASNVVYHHLGTLGEPDAVVSAKASQEVLVFGKFGGAKIVDVAIGAHQVLRCSHPNARLRIVGVDHPRHEGYLAAAERDCARLPGIRFDGYVPEDRVPETFRRASVVALTHATTTGHSSVLTLASMYGTPAVAPDLAAFHEVADEDGLLVTFYRPGDARDLAARLAEFLDSPERQKQVAEHNLQAIRKYGINKLAAQYVALFSEVIAEASCERRRRRSCTARRTLRQPDSVRDAPMVPPK